MSIANAALHLSTGVDTVANKVAQRSWVVSIDSKHAEAIVLPNFMDSFRLRDSQVISQVAIFVLTTTTLDGTTNYFLPCMHMG
jgi:hypothetical protein